jgi:predicted CXXCH cytochrome family protein
VKKITGLIGSLVGGLACLSTAYGGIIGSAHDFSNAAWSGGEICVPCHAPHNNLDVEDAPLWNHEVSTAVYELYTSPTFDADDISQPGGVSKLCLSCHDGTVAIDSFGGATGSRLIGGKRNLGTDLSDDHPVSFVYDSELATIDGGLYDPVTTSSIFADGTIETDMLFAGKMECASCHDVHNKYEVRCLLKMSNEGSALCLTCHNK